MVKRIFRVDQRSGEVFEPHRYKDGTFRVADPRLGNEKHRAANQIVAKSDHELAAYIRLGYHCRMRGQVSGQVNLFRPDDIVVQGYSGETSPGVSAGRPEADETVHDVSFGAAAVTPVGGSHLLPAHGRISCGRCFPGGDPVWGVSSVEVEGWRLENNPMAWGSRNPRVLVLGFSKGPRQSSDLLERRHEDVAFARGRKPLGKILARLGLIQDAAAVDRLIADPEGDFAFGSLIRCSVSKFDPYTDTWLKTGKDIMASCLRHPAANDVARRCADTFLADLPSRVRVVIMMGNDLRYVEGCRSTLSAVRPGISSINEVAYGDGKVVFVHTVHFAAQGSVLPNWCDGEPGLAASPDSDQPRKRELVLDAIRGLGLSAGL